MLLALVTLLAGVQEASGWDLAGGNSHTCLIDDNGMSCWGWDESGQCTVARHRVFSVAKSVPGPPPTFRLVLVGRLVTVGSLIQSKRLA